MPSRGRNGHFGSRQCTGQLVVIHGGDTGNKLIRCFEPASLSFFIIIPKSVQRRLARSSNTPLSWHGHVCAAKTRDCVVELISQILSLHGDLRNPRDRDFRCRFPTIHRDFVVHSCAPGLPQDVAIALVPPDAQKPPPQPAGGSHCLGYHLGRAGEWQGISEGPISRARQPLRAPC
jgi:hypothetical protein